MRLSRHRSNAALLKDGLMLPVVADGGDWGSGLSWIHLLRSSRCTFDRRRCVAKRVIIDPIRLLLDVRLTPPPLSPSSGARRAVEAAKSQQENDKQNADDDENDQQDLRQQRERLQLLWVHGSQRVALPRVCILPLSEDPLDLVGDL